MSSLLLSSDSFDPSSGLWTYNYSVDNSANNGSVFEFGIFVGGFPSEAPGFHAVAPIAPTMFSVPIAGWTFDSGISGGIANPPVNINGGLYVFYYGGGTMIGPGEISPAFSFSTSFGPSTDGGANDYFTAGSGDPNNSGINGFGNVVVPSGSDWTVAPNAVPLPSTLPLLLGGVVAVGGLLRKARR